MRNLFFLIIACVFVLPFVSQAETNGAHPAAGSGMVIKQTLIRSAVIRQKLHILPGGTSLVLIPIDSNHFMELVHLKATGLSSLLPEFQGGNDDDSFSLVTSSRNLTSRSGNIEDLQRLQLVRNRELMASEGQEVDISVQVVKSLVLWTSTHTQEQNCYESLSGIFSLELADFDLVQGGQQVSRENKPMRECKPQTSL